MRDLLSDLN